MAIFNQLIEKRINRAIGLSVLFGTDSVRYELVVVEKSVDGDLKIVESQIAYEANRIVDWLNDKASGLPIMWGIDGKQVLVKIAQIEEDAHEEIILRSLLQNANQNDFIINAIQEENITICGLIRREAYQSVIDEFLAMGLSLYKGFVGPIPMLSIRKHLKNSDADNYRLGRYLIIESGGNIKNINRNSEGLSDPGFNNTGIEPELLNAFTYASTFFTKADSEYIISETEVNKNGPTEFANKKIHKPFLYTSVAVLLLLFLGNAWFFIQKTRENELLKEQSSSTRMLVANYEKRNRLYIEKNDIVKALNYDNTGIAWISDQIGAVIPPEVQLTELIISPVARKNKKKSPFSKELIVVSGNSADNKSFGKLVSAISGLPMVEEIRYQNYSFNRRSGKGEFELGFSYKYSD